MNLIFIKNLIPWIKDQLPWTRFLRNVVINRNAWGAFYKRSHINFNGTPKVMYNTKETATKVAKKMTEKHGKYFSNYKCLYCDGYHLGKNRDNK